jgi:hypothetical protein
LIKKHVIAVEARKKLTHAVGKINRANIILDAMRPEDEDDEENTGGAVDDGEFTEVPCGACIAIEVHRL